MLTSLSVFHPGLASVVVTKSDTTKCLPRREKLPTKPHNANYIRIDAWGNGISDQNMIEFSKVKKQARIHWTPLEIKII